MKKNETEFQGLFKAGLIVTICLSSITIAYMLIYVLFMTLGAILSGGGAGLVLGIAAIIMMLYTVGSLVTLILSAIALKKRDTKTKISLGVLGIIFGGLIGGILVLCAPKVEEKNININRDMNMNMNRNANMDRENMYKEQVYREMNKEQNREMNRDPNWEDNGRDTNNFFDDNNQNDKKQP